MHGTSNGRSSEQTGEHRSVSKAAALSTVPGQPPRRAAELPRGHFAIGFVAASFVNANDDEVTVARRII